MTEQDVRDLRGAIEALRGDFDRRFDELTKKVIELATLARTEKERCPYRVDIAAASNNKARLSALEKIVYGGGGVSVIGYGILELGKRAGWW